MPNDVWFGGQPICHACAMYDTDGYDGISPFCAIGEVAEAPGECASFLIGAPMGMRVHERDNSRSLRDAIAYIGIAGDR